MIAIAVAAFVTQLVTSCLHLAGVWLASRALGVAVRRVQLGIGPTPLRGKVGEVTLALGVPLGSYVQFARDDVEGPDDPDAELPPDALERAPLAKRLAITLAGPLAMAVVPIVGLGPIDGARSIARGVPQVVLGTLSPLGTAQELLDAAAALPFLTLAPVLAAKLVAFNLLPIPGTSLWTTLRGLLGFRSGRGCLGALGSLAIATSWIVALVAWSLR